MPSECTFKLTKANAPYFVGDESVQGIVTLKTRNKKIVKDIQILFHGCIKCRYVFDHDYIEGDPGLEVSSTNYMSCKDIVFEKVIVHKQGLLPAGIHSWQYNFALPANCLTSVEGEWGHIRYELTLRLSNQNMYDNIFKYPVSVIQELDINKNPVLKMPQECKVDTTCCIGPGIGNILYEFSTPRSAYVPGQTIPFSLKIENKTLQKIDFYEVNLVKKMVFTFKVPHVYTKQTETVLCKKNILDNGGKEQSVNDDILIPSTPPTMHGDMISVEYVLRVKPNLVLSTSNLKAELSIVIGTTPFAVKRRHSMDTGEEEPDLPSCSSAIDETKLCTFKMSEPLCSPFEDQDTEEINRVKDFSPLYPVYKQ